MGQKCDKRDWQDEVEMAHGVCAETPRDFCSDIMQLMEAGNLVGFVSALPSGEALNQRYASWEGETLLERACRVDLGGHAVAALLQRGARAEERNERQGCSALHIAADSLNDEALRTLLRHSNPNVLNRRGDNALHALCRHLRDSARAEDVLRLCAEVLRLCTEEAVHLDVNHRNRDGHTPVYVAASEKNEHVVRLLLDHGCKIDSDDTWRAGKRCTARHLLREWAEFQHPMLEEVAPSGEGFERSLVFLLYFREEEEFLLRLRAEAEADPTLGFLEAHDGRLTLLQVATQKRLPRAVEALLDLGADPDRTLPGEPTACEDAAYRGIPEVLELLIARGATLARENELSAMHLLIKGACEELRNPTPHGSQLSEDYKQCFNELLEKNELLNMRDKNGCTPLHYAASHRISYFLDKLIDNGALLGLRDENDSTPVDLITPTDLDKFLNRRIELSDPLEPVRKVTFDLRFLRYFDDNKVEQYDCRTLVLISKCEMQSCVLTHPLVACFLHMKLQAITVFYFIFLLMYSIFAFLLGARIHYDEYHMPGNSSLIEKKIAKSRSISDYEMYLNCALGIFLAIITFLTVFYYLVSWDSLHSVRRCLLKGLIGLSTVLLLCRIGGEQWRPLISNIAILLACTELVLLMGDYPKHAAYVKMLKTVSWNFFKFFIWFSPILLAFIFSFSLLFRNTSKTFFHNLGYWFFRSFIMITGEFEADDLMESTITPIVSHVVFIMFVFFVAIVLFNLLNALAVNDTITINEDTELFVNISQIKLLRHAEIVLTFLHKLCNKGNAQNLLWIRRKVLQRIEYRMQVLCLKDFLVDGKIIFETNKKNKWETKSRALKVIVMKTKIIEAAQNIKKLEEANLQDLKRKMIN